MKSQLAARELKTPLKILQEAKAGCKKDRDEGGPGGKKVQVTTAKRIDDLGSCSEEDAKTETLRSCS